MGIYFTSDFEHAEPVEATGPSGGTVAGLVRFLRRPFEAASRHQERSRQRADMAALDDHLLSDIGLSRADIEHRLLLDL
jgi:uncharacterized protein YjiS (DUF1127 family)